MKMQLTHKPSGKVLIVESDAIKFYEPLDDGGTHIVFGPDLGRAVMEDVATISAALGIIMGSHGTVVTPSSGAV